jgi:hypothetical protein
MDKNFEVLEQWRTHSISCMGDDYNSKTVFLCPIGKPLEAKAPILDMYSCITYDRYWYSVVYKGEKRDFVSIGDADDFYNKCFDDLKSKYNLL